MTRINCVPPAALTNAFLLAEYRELLRTRHMHPRDAMPSVPTYRMGRGHVLFFADKGAWLLKRHAALRAEMQRRGYETRYELDLSHWPAEAMGQWSVTPAALRVNWRRLYERGGRRFL